jgi:hypothetical protein
MTKQMQQQRADEKLTVTGVGELAFLAPGVEVRGGGPAALILEGPEERPVQVQPAGREAAVSEFAEASPMGPMCVRQLDWPDAGPGVWRVTLHGRRRAATQRLVLDGN